MNFIRAVLALVLLVAAAACARSDSGLEAFAERFREAAAAESSEPMLQLYQLDGVSSDTRQLLALAIDHELGLPIRSIEFLPLQNKPEETISFIHKERTYEATLIPSKRMRVTYATEDHFSSLYTIGQNEDSKWHIIMARPTAKE